jgi:hypothetical protein
MAERKSWFTEQRFCESVRDVVTEFARNGASAKAVGA